MKAKLLVDYLEHTKGSEFKVVEIAGTRCTLLINDVKVDFGISEVEIITRTNSDLYYVGCDIYHRFKSWAAKQNEIDFEIKNLKYPLSKRLMQKAVNHYLNS